MIRLDSVRKTRGQSAQRYSLEIDRLHLAAGERVALVGPSGCGKSTLLDLLALVLAPDAAQGFALGGEDVAGLWRARQLDRLASWRSRHLGYVLQAGGLLGFLDVRGNIRLPRQLLGLGDDGSVERLAEALDVHDQLGKKPATLSIGQRQRVSCARALAHGPTLLLADEPTAALDPVNAERVMQLLLREAEARQVTCVVATHDEALARQAGLTVLRMACRRDADGGVTASLERAA
ncbi:MULTISPECIES: ABC transporter ATP-binding protein [unclassified Pseudomonas]|uniref:ABC transporter ATP-binding protein n=1 Tax=unclassified Pseudomonas TaxID=196821 RepID=UPI000C88052B|nr:MULTISPECIES: ABC transporter ATP-binding protein [unclassified Pseudomonas]PNA02306.1 ABC transporter ATP-binding protein [Pseudomonas sp. FW305-42]PNA26609.1 ABC transporter ATP-binding protein [Pseudomonas sp. MPR-R1B]PNB29168.1 ABC transporter ATP-binding protein [Pseudomonas sp. DP16D-E2]PNB44416.1 ABC transporter ATP-binding protein [Pseudomonas sp. FW305-17]PNB63747.1 ABC transporter ATP-binding protein [Pseudomonas sp. GW531-E2]